MEETIKLNLACGNDYREGYINIDNQSMFNGKVDRRADVKGTLRFKKGSVSEILLLHFMMYITPEELPRLLDRWYGWLAHNGRLVIETGDLKKIAKTISLSDDPEIINGTNGVMQLFGINETKGHTWAWCYETLEPFFMKANFHNISRQDGGTHNRPERDITIVARK